MPRRRLIYPQLVQVERNTKCKTQFFIFIS